jgi:hypothetical protein
MCVQIEDLAGAVERLGFLCELCVPIPNLRDSGLRHEIFPLFFPTQKLHYNALFACLTSTRHANFRVHSSHPELPMKRTPSRVAIITTIIFVTLITAVSIARTQTNPSTTSQKAAQMSKHATGSFDVKLTVQTDDKVGDPSVGRMSIDKVYHGDLEATSKGQMLSTVTEVKGSAGYVAIERVTGTLQGHTGSFSLQHNATMNRGVPELNVIVIPDSGTGQLVGLTGKLNIIITDGKHSYEFDYTLPDSPK